MGVKKLIAAGAQRVCEPVFQRLGYTLQPFNRRQLVPEHVPDAELYTRPEDLSRLYRPWRDPRQTAWLTPEVEQNTMLSRQKLYLLRKLLLATLGVPGDVFEAGAGSGGSTRLMLDTLAAAGSGKAIWTLDTFAGYQKVDRAHDGAHVAIADCRCAGVDDVRRLLASPAVPVHVVQGLIPGTLAEVAAEAIAFAHVDVNLYEPTLAATAFVLERMPPGGIVVFDDYNWPATYGARAAIDEACGRFGQEVIAVPESTQAFVLRR